MLHTIPAEIGHIAIDIRQCDGFYQYKVNVHDIDLVKWQALQRGIAELLDVAEEIAQIKVVLIHSALRVRFDGLVIAKKVRQYLRRLGAIVNGHNDILILNIKYLQLQAAVAPRRRQRIQQQRLFC